MALRSSRLPSGDHPHGVPLSALADDGSARVRSPVPSRFTTCTASSLSAYATWAAFGDHTPERPCAPTTATLCAPPPPPATAHSSYDAGSPSGFGWGATVFGYSTHEPSRDHTPRSPSSRVMAEPVATSTFFSGQPSAQEDQRTWL